MKYIMTFLGIAVLITLLNRPAISLQEKQQMLHPPSKILAFGDSLTYGFGAKPQEDYPSVLAARTGLEVINAGINGETSEEGLRRLSALLQDSNIKLMILCFGGNDILQKKPYTQLKSNLKRMITMARDKEIGVLLVSVPDISLFGLSPLALYDEVSSEMDVPLLSGVLSNILAKPSLKSDQIHPNGAGYRILAEKIYEKMREQGWI